MRRSLSAIIAVLACFPVGWLAFGLPLPGMARHADRVRSVPDGDAEIAWLHTTTNAATWERFVKGMNRIPLTMRDVIVDDSAAFPSESHVVPEVAISKTGHPGTIRIRWYKLSNESTAADWVKRLVARSTPPVAIVGGGSSDRAADLARAMAAHAGVEGPLLFLTTASADKVAADPSSETPIDVPLVKLYPDRTFRFCFSNRQMAAATVDFVWGRDDLRPTASDGKKPKAIVLHWDDDPFSTDLRDQFRSILFSRADLVKWSEPLPFSIGGATMANRYELRAADFVVGTLRDDPAQRAVLVLPTVTAPARRVLRAIAEREPSARTRLVVLNGDGIPLNAVYRDGPYLWPIDQLPVPLVLFAHANPFGWDAEVSNGSRNLVPTTSTEDVLHFNRLMTMAVDAAFMKSSLTLTANDLKRRLREIFPSDFDDDGNRLGGNGEFVAVVHPRSELDPPRIAVWRHGETWDAVATYPLPAPRGGE